MPWRLPTCALVSAAIGCGGVTDAGPRDASSDAVVDTQLVGDAQVVADATAPPPRIGDAEPDEGEAADVSPLPSFDASLPASPSCEAGSFFVTVVDGAGTRLLDGGCWGADAGAWAVPAVVPWGCGNLCGYAELEVCGDGLSLMLQTSSPFPGIASAVSFTVFAQFDDGNGTLLIGGGTMAFDTPPFAPGAYGTTLAGSYTETLMTSEGQPVGAIAGTFCVLDGF